MALIRRRISGFYVDGECEVFIVYDDVTDKLVDIKVVGNTSRLVDVMVDGVEYELDKNQTRETSFDVRSQDLTVKIPPSDNITDPHVMPHIRCTYYRPDLTRVAINQAKGR